MGSLCLFHRRDESTPLGGAAFNPLFQIGGSDLRGHGQEGAKEAVGGSAESFAWESGVSGGFGERRLHLFVARGL